MPWKHGVHRTRDDLNRTVLYKLHRDSGKIKVIWNDFGRRWPCKEKDIRWSSQNCSQWREDRKKGENHAGQEWVSQKKELMKMVWLFRIKEWKKNRNATHHGEYYWHIYTDSVTSSVNWINNKSEILVIDNTVIKRRFKYRDQQDFKGGRVRSSEIFWFQDGEYEQKTRGRQMRKQTEQTDDRPQQQKTSAVNTEQKMDVKWTHPVWSLEGMKYTEETLLLKASFLRTDSERA